MPHFQPKKLDGISWPIALVACVLSGWPAPLTQIAAAATPQPTTPARPIVGTPLVTKDLGPATFAQWVDGEEKPLDVSDGPRHAIWTRDSAPVWDGVHFGASKKPGIRHMRIGWKNSVPV